MPASTTRALAWVLGGTLALALSARLQIPMYPVPMTLQSYVVLVIGALAGARLGALTVGVYVVAALVGLPVLAGGAAGVGAVIGKTGGYLAGFVAAVIWAGRRAPQRARLALLAVMVIGHAIILVLGGAWLATFIGVEKAVAGGVAPFLFGALLKSVLAAATVEAARRRRSAA